MDSKWAASRRSRALLVLGTIGFLFLSAYVLVGVYEPPTCNDNKRNQEEQGVDCEGPCEALCASSVNPLIVQWVRPLEVTPNNWSVVAYIENPNPDAYVRTLEYVFTIYDRENNVLYTREGETFITHERVTPIFEGRIPIEEGVPYRSEIEWKNATNWVRVPTVYDVAVIEERALNTMTKPRIEATFLNQDPRPLRDIEVVAIVYDIQGNTIAASETFIEFVPGRGSESIVFTWPQPFASPVERIELVPRIREQVES